MRRARERRAAVAVAVALAAGPAQAGERAEARQARRAQASQTDQAPLSDELVEPALGHVLKAVKLHEERRYGEAEAEFKRAAYFAPNWRPLHFNLAVVAEAQGKLDTALTEYRSFRPHIGPEQQLLVDQRIDELSRRRARIASVFRRQIAGSSVALVISAGAVAGAVALFFVGHQRYAEGKISKDQAGGFYGGGVLVGIYGFASLVVSIMFLERGLKSKRILSGLALGPTRLQWTGGLGARLRF